MRLIELRPLFVGAFIAALLFSGQALALECGPDARDDERIAKGEDIYVKFRAEPGPPPMGDLFVVLAQACSPAHTPLDGQLGADAIMPAHGHGMNYAVKPVNTRQGAARLEGFLWQMPGLWQVRFRLKSGSQTYRATYDYEFAPQ